MFNSEYLVFLRKRAKISEIQSHIIGYNPHQFVIISEGGESFIIVGYYYIYSDKLFDKFASLFSLSEDYWIAICFSQ